MKYNNEKKKRNVTMVKFIEIELINYIYKVLSLFERLLYTLIQGKNDYRKSNYYFKQIEEYENKMDNTKKIMNNRAKKMEELLRRKKINEDAIRKWNKIIFMPYKKVPQKYHIIRNKKEMLILKKENEMENLLLY